MGESQTNPCRNQPSKINNMKDIKDYLHLYLGCEVMCHYEERSKKGDYDFKGTFEGIDCGQYQVFHGQKKAFLVHKYNAKNIKPILRPLSDMTENEAKELAEIKRSPSAGKTVTRTELYAATTHYLLSKHFDLFGLIESGLAIDKTKL